MDLKAEQCSQPLTSHSMEASAVSIMTDRENLLKKISEYQFAALDLQLYLDTHPENREMLRKMTEYKNEMYKYREEFERKYGPLTKNMNDTNNWQWVKGPWPWESEDED